MKKKYTLLAAVFTITLAISTNAQINWSEEFIEIQKEMQVEIFDPVEESYRKSFVGKNTIYNYDFAIKSKKKDLEIRYDLLPEYKNAIPHIQSISISSTVATNNDDAMMALHEMSNSDLEKYNADWGAVFFFQPKKTFSSKKHGKMIAIFKEGRGMVVVFFLFDKPSEEIDLQKYGLSFLEKEK